MQRVPDAMLQALQRQGEEEGGRRRGRSETRTQRGPADVRSSHWQTYPSSFTFTSDGPYSTPASPSTPSPLDSETSRYPRLPGAQVSRGRRGGTGRRAGVDYIGAATEPESEAAQQIRPVSGSRALEAPSREPATETIPSQLLGRRAKGNADILNLNSHTIDFATQLVDRAPSDVRSPGPAVRPAPLLSPTWFSRRDTSAVSSRRISEQQNQPRPPSPDGSESSFGAASKASRKSDASSFAYMLRDRREDLRLFKKSSRPFQHSTKPSTTARPPPPPRRSSSYYKPKVVEDTADLVVPGASSASPESSPHLRPTTPISRPPKTPIRKARSSPSSSTSETALLLSPFGSPSARRTALSSPDHSFDRSVARTQQQQVGLVSQSSSHSRESSQSRHHRQPSPTPSIAKRRYLSDTPPEEEPRAPYDTTDRHGSHYFRTFGADTIYQTEEFRAHPRRPSPRRLERQDTLRDISSPVSPMSPASPPLLYPQSPDEAAKDIQKHYKRGSIFDALLHPGGTHHIFHGGHHKTESEQSASPTPDITVSSPQLAKSRRLSSYFTRPRRTQQSSDATPSPAVSGLSTNWEDVVAESQPPGHAKEISEPTSPLSVPPPVKRPQPTPVQDRIIEPPRQIREETIIEDVPSKPAVRRRSTYKSSTGEEFHKVSLSDPKGLSFLPSEMQRVNTPPESKKPKGFKGFFFDMRSMPSDSAELEPESPEARASKRRGPILQTKSMQLLVQKLSLSKLRRKSSQVIEERKLSENPLAVTAFQQTPFSQRYGDARRAKMSQIRSYMEEALKEEDDDEGGGGAFPFTLNVPEHLPNSPLCPLSPKHASGGKAICPIHGRKRTTVWSGLSPRPGKALRPEPTIVFESGLQNEGRTPALEELRRTDGGM